MERVRMTGRRVPGPCEFFSLSFSCLFQSHRVFVLTQTSKKSTRRKLI